MMDFNLIHTDRGYVREWFVPVLPDGVTADQYIGSRLKALRQRFGLSRSVLADYGLNPRSIEAFEQGRRSFLSASFSTAYTYARVLCITIDALYCLCDPQSDFDSIPETFEDRLSIFAL